MVGFLATLLLLSSVGAPPTAGACSLEPMARDISKDQTWTASISYSADEWVPRLDGQWDWLRLTSGEWLKGEVKEMRQDSIEFDSDELELLKLGWSDVAEIEMPTRMLFGFEATDDLQGPGRVSKDAVVVSTRDGPVCRPRSTLVSIVRGATRELDHWSLNTHVGLNANYGNSRQASLSADFTAKRQDASTRLRLSYYGNVGHASGELNTHNHRGEVQFDIYLTRRFYLAAFRDTSLYDKFQNIRIRTVPSSGAGWTAIDVPAFELDLELSAGYQYTRYISVNPGEDIDDHNVGALFSPRFEWDVTKNLDFDVSHQMFLGFINFGQSTFLTRVDLDYEWTDILDVGLALEHTRVREPVADQDGNVPEKDDIKIIFKLGVSFD